MARNTNIDDLLFEVQERLVYLEGKKTPVPGFKAITGYFEKEKYDKPTVFSVVTSNYNLVPNFVALELGKSLHKKLFPGASAASFEVFNITAPKTRSYCNIDIIDKNYSINIYKQEVYLPFIRIQNSYNRISALRFDLGFYRKLCDNGVIFEQNTISLKYNHTRQIKHIDDFINIDTSHFNAMVKDFSSKIQFITIVPLSREYFIAMAALILGKQFKIDSSDEYEKWDANNKLDKFAMEIDSLTDKYIGDFGETAYTLYNVITDYASNNNHPVIAANSMQWRCGNFLKTLEDVTKHNDFNWLNYLGSYQKLLPKKVIDSDKVF